MLSFFKKRKKFIKKLFLLFIALSILGLSLVALWVSTFKIPTLDSFEERKVVQSTKIYDRTGETLLYDVFENIKRTIIPFEDISVNIKNATIAIEDTEFYEHNGVRPVAFMRAALTNLITLDPYGQGGSTITQQVVKNSILTPEKKISRKLKEWVLAVRLEQVLEKDEILNLYLNETPYGGSVYGVEEASQRFFNKSASEVSVAEAAYLAALPQAPTYYSPYGNNVEALEKRKNLVLERMLQENFIDQDGYNEAKSETVEFAKQDEDGIKAPHFVIYVRELLTQRYGEDLVQSGGLSVKTTLDWDLQQKAEEIVKRRALSNKEAYDAENAALVAIDPQSGEILAMVGSRDYFDEEIDGNFNVALAKRQPGSAFKPFAYAKAFEKGYTPETTLFDLKTQFSAACAPSNLSSSGDCYSPNNYLGTFSGPISMRNALAQSINVPAIKTLYLAGTDDTLNLAKDLGITTLTNSDRYGLTLVLGGGEVRPLDMTSAYGAFATGGILNEDTPILEVLNSDGDVLEEKEDNPRRVLDENVAYQISDILSDNVARTPVFGPVSNLYVPGYQVASKTGTTNDFRDAWILGYTPKIVVGAWAGNNDNHSMSSKAATTVVGPIWNEFMREVLPEYAGEGFPKPESVENPYRELKPVLRGVWTGGISNLVDSSSGKLASDNTPEDSLREIATGGIHSILHWVDKNNPRGPIPQNPNNDPQYTLWEYPVKLWAERQNISVPEENDVPDEFSDTHSDENKPRIIISIPGNLSSSSTVELEPRIRSEFDIEKVEYYVNSEYIGSSSRNPFSITLILSNVSNISTENTLRAVAYDEFGNKGEVFESFSINQ